MRVVAKRILWAGALAIGANVLMAAPQTNASAWLDQFYRAKLGRSSPMTEARERAEAATAAYREATAREVSGPENPWLEQLYKAKLGRNSPMEETRLRAEEENAAYREEARPEVRPANDWFERWFKAKFGRSSPLEH
jgi:hypothetical protein